MNKFIYRNKKLNGTLDDVFQQLDANLPEDWELIQILKEYDHPRMWTLIFKIKAED